MQGNCEFLEDSVYLSYKFKWVSSNNPYIQLKGIKLNKQTLGIILHLVCLV
jgi:hypothetical protein